MRKKHGLPLFTFPYLFPLIYGRKFIMDFIVKLPRTTKDKKPCLINTNRLSRVTFTPICITTAQNVASAFIQHFLPVHDLLKAIVSDKGPQYIGQI